MSLVLADPVLSPDSIMSTIADETSSGVASLDGNESSREPWDVEERSNESEQASPASLPIDLPPLTPLSQLLASNTMPTITHSEEEGAGDIDGETSQLMSVESENHLDIATANQTNASLISQPTDTDTRATSTQIPSAPVGSKGTNVPAAEITSSEAYLSDRMEGGEVAEQTNSTFSSTQVSQAGDISHTFTHTIGAHTTSASSSASQSPSAFSTVANTPTSDPNMHFSTSSTESELFIPRLIDGPLKDGSKVQPKVWKPEDVAQFLKTNDCGAYCDNFVAQVSLQYSLVIVTPLLICIIVY